MKGELDDLVERDSLVNSQNLPRSVNVVAVVAVVVVRTGHIDEHFEEVVGFVALVVRAPVVAGVYWDDYLMKRD